jgi:hypothetical protein
MGSENQFSARALPVNQQLVTQLNLVPQPPSIKISMCLSELVSGAGSNRRPSAFQAHPPGRCTWLVGAR